MRSVRVELPNHLLQLASVRLSQLIRVNRESPPNSVSVFERSRGEHGFVSIDIVLTNDLHEWSFGEVGHSGGVDMLRLLLPFCKQEVLCLYCHLSVLDLLDLSIDEARELAIDSVILVKWTVDGSRFEEVWVVANLSQLHEDIHNAEEVSVDQSLLCLSQTDVLIVEESLTAREVAVDDVLHFLRKLLFNILLHSSKQEWSEDALESSYYIDVDGGVMILRLLEWVLEPLPELLFRLEDLRHQEVHQ